jgi:hypothetical protein
MINSSGINTAAVNASAAAAAGPLDIRETAVITGNELIGDRADVTDRFVGRGDAFFGERVYVTDSAVITGDYVPPLTRGLTARATGLISNTFDIVRLAPLNVRDPAVILDASYTQRVVHVDLTDTAVILGAAEENTGAFDVLETAVITGATSYQVTARYTVRDSAQITDRPFLGGLLAVTDTAVVTGTATPLRTARYVVRETALITGTDANDLPQDLRVDITESAVVLGYASSRLTARLDIRDDAYASDNMASSDGLAGVGGLPADTVWTTNISSWGMSRHSGTGITQRGVRFAVSPAGLYEIGAEYASAELDTGFMSFGSKALKHVSAVYIRGERDGEMIISVTADRNGQRATHSYEPIARDHSDSRTVRADIGRGYRSTYYKLHIQTAGRAEIFGGGLLVATTQRRI